MLHLLIPGMMLQIFFKLRYQPDDQERAAQGAPILEVDSGCSNAVLTRLQPLKAPTNGAWWK